MTGMFDDILNRFDLKNPRQRENATREIVQEMTLCGLSQTDFFERAAFMGGTDLRILYGLNRFSEDLDFMLKTQDEQFTLDPYLDEVSSYLETFDLSFDVNFVEKTNRTNIKEGMVKTNTKELYLKFYSKENYADAIYPTQMTKVKIEIDTNPAENAIFENRYKTQPFGYKVSSCNLPTMFSGKIHAILCRPWVNRFKGRDLYDFIFFVNRGVPYNIRFLNSKLQGTSDFDGDLSHEEIMRMLCNRFDEIDYKSAIDDVVNFISDNEFTSVHIWCSEMFKQISENIKYQ